mmetsp:Transcript_2757/g.5769  ORF Transcript_2757/g.5769 Transcript_2757/m.5769 type:complete len:278 (+) Transcript_2757:324-1157(+)
MFPVVIVAARLGIIEHILKYWLPHEITGAIVTTLENASYDAIIFPFGTALCTSQVGWIVGYTKIVFSFSNWILAIAATTLFRGPVTHDLVCRGVPPTIKIRALAGIICIGKGWTNIIGSSPHAHQLYVIVQGSFGISVMRLSNNGYNALQSWCGSTISRQFKRKHGTIGTSHGPYLIQIDTQIFLHLVQYRKDLVDTIIARRPTTVAAFVGAVTSRIFIIVTESFCLCRTGGRIRGIGRRSQTVRRSTVFPGIVASCGTVSRHADRDETLFHGTYGT